MNIKIKATHVSLTPDIESYLRKRLAKLEKFLPHESGGVLTEIELAKTTDHHRSGDVYRAEINLTVAGKNLYAAAEENAMKAAIDKMQAEIIRELNSYKGKRRSIFRRGASQIKKMLRFGKGIEE